MVVVTRWQLFSGFSGSDFPERPATIFRIQWQRISGMAGNYYPEYAVVVLLLLSAINESEWRRDMRLFDCTRQKLITTALQHPNDTITVNNLPQIDKSIPLFMNTMPTLIEFYIPSFKGRVVVNYSDFGSGTTVITLTSKR